MNSQVLETIIGQLGGLIEEHGFKPGETEAVYQNDRLAFRIGYDEKSHLLLLDTAPVDASGEIGGFSNASSWLFEEPENLRDAESAGLDFLDTLKGSLGIRRVRTGRSGEVVMPRQEAGGAVNIESLCVKTLAIFPQFKEAYKEHVSHYGTLLYIEFFKSTLTVKLGELLDENNKKALKKVFSMLSDMYTEGDRAVQNVVLGVVLGGAVRDSEQRYQTALSYMENDVYLKNAFIPIMERVKKDKRFQQILAG